MEEERGPSSPLHSYAPSVFASVRVGSRGEEISEEDPQIDIATVQDMLSSHHYKTFKVSMIHRLRFTTDVQLGESGGGGAVCVCGQRGRDPFNSGPKLAGGRHRPRRQVSAMENVPLKEPPAKREASVSQPCNQHPVIPAGWQKPAQVAESSFSVHGKF